MKEGKDDYKIVIDQEPEGMNNQSSVVAPSVIKLSPGLRASLPIACYCFASILMTITNKYVLSGFDFNMNFLLLAIQNLVTVMLLISFRFLNLIKFRAFDTTEARKWLPIAISLVAMIYTGSKALQFLRIPIYTIFKNLTIILIAYGEVLWFGGKVTHMMLVSFGLMVLSSVIAGWSDVNDALTQITDLDTTFIGYFWMASNCIASAAFVLYMRKRIKLTNFKDFDTVYYNNILSIPFLIVPSLLFEDYGSENLARNFPIEVRTQIITAMVFSGVSAFVMSYASAWCVRTTSSTTYSMVGALNKLPIAASGILFFGDPATFGNVMAIIVGFIAGLFYTVAKTVSNKVNTNKDVIPMSSSSQSNADAKSDFKLSSITDHFPPLLNTEERLVGIWKSITWPVCLKILKANFAVTILLGLFFFEPVAQYTKTAGILGCVAVEFVQPAKSYGFIAEDIFIGSIMCCVSASWAILGTYLASLVKDPNDTTMAQPKPSMVSATIMVISLTGSVLTTEFTAITTLRALIPTLAGFTIVFLIFIFIFPENSTKVYMENLIKALETFDDIHDKQSKAFLKIPIEGSDHVDSVSFVNNTIDQMITTIIQRKRIVRREFSYNTLSPTDISALTSYTKKLKVPLQGLSLSRAMEEKMRQATDKVVNNNNSRSNSADRNTLSMFDPGPSLGPLQQTYSLFSATDDDDEILSDDDTTALPPAINSSTSTLSDERTHDSSTKGNHSHSREKIRWEESLKVMSFWRSDYDEVLKLVAPIYHELVIACSVAMKESIKRLRRLQQLDPRYQDKPHFYRYYYRWKVGKLREAEERLKYDYEPSHDPSLPLADAIHKFYRDRLTGLDKLYTRSGVPRRILFLLLTYQFNIYTYAESLYTLTSFISELDHSRDDRQFSIPQISFMKWTSNKYGDDEFFEMAPPGAIAETTNPLSTTLLKRVTKLASKNLSEKEPTDSLYKLESLQRGTVNVLGEGEPTRQNERMQEATSKLNVWRNTTLDHLTYHDPDVAFPETPTQRFFYACYLYLIKHVYTADVAYSLRAATVVAALSLPGFLDVSVKWYNSVRGQWSVVVALIWMGPSVGSNFFGTMTRTVGTFIGAVVSILIWEISRGEKAGLLAAYFVFNIPWWLLYINGRFWKATGLFALITVSIIIGYSSFYEAGTIRESIYTITWQRTVDVLVGVLAALIISVFPYPYTGRVILRYRVAQTLSEIGALYSTFLALFLRNRLENMSLELVDEKLFKSVSEAIQRQIKGERVLLEQSRFEPALRGVFQEEKYLRILQALENILCLSVQMNAAIKRIPYEWRMMISTPTWRERKEMISAYLTALYLASNALSTKKPLPPYIIRPTKARRKLTDKARRLEALKIESLGNKEYTYFSAYLMNSEQFAVELELLVATIRDLLGPDKLSLWLNYKH
ncbi:hypothetical protein BDB01DRAFT_859003 [Pilobolus umbonatus]|nr:hypothetical protein BDB01DRAFT_859003 [Pilobolus umbonatus]